MIADPEISVTKEVEATGRKVADKDHRLVVIQMDLVGHKVVDQMPAGQIREDLLVEDLETTSDRR